MHEPARLFMKDDAQGLKVGSQLISKHLIPLGLRGGETVGFKCGLSVGAVVELDLD